MENSHGAIESLFAGLSSPLILRTGLRRLFCC
jgi:hypothetical protein